MPKSLLYWINGVRSKPEGQYEEKGSKSSTGTTDSHQLQDEHFWAFYFSANSTFVAKREVKSDVIQLVLGSIHWQKTLLATPSVEIDKENAHMQHTRSLYTICVVLNELRH